MLGLKHEVNLFKATGCEARVESCGKRWGKDEYLVERWTKKFLHVARESKAVREDKIKGLNKYLEDMTEEETTKHIVRKLQQQEEE